MSFAISAAAVGAGLGYLGTKDTNDTQAKIAADTNRQNQANYNKYLEVMKDAGKPRWDERQEPYVFGGEAWIPRMPDLNPDAQDYWTKMAEGGLPGVDRAAGPIGLDELMGMLSNGGSQQINDLLGWGTQAPPPLWTPGSAPPQQGPPQAPQAPQAPQYQPPPQYTRPEQVMRNGLFPNGLDSRTLPNMIGGMG
jgi:hypothetical protein